MPEENGQAVFQEVLEIGVDANAFTNGLRQIEAEWDSFIQRVSAKGLDSASVLNVGGIASVSSSLQGLSGELATVRQGIAETLTVMSNTLAESMGKVTEVIDQKFQATAASNKKEVEDVISSEDRKVGAVSAAADRIARIRAKFEETLEFAEMKALQAVERAEAAKTAVATAQTNLRAKIDGDATTKQVDSARKVLEAAQVAERTRTEIAASYSKQREAIANGESQAVIRSLQNEVRALESEASRASGTLVKALKADNLENQGFLSRAFGRFTKDLPEFAAGIFRLTLGLQASYAALNAIIATLEFLPKRFAEGWEYLNKIQQAADDIRPLLVDNVKFSDDFATNLRMAGDAALQVEQRLEDLAASTGQKQETIRRNFEAFMEAGGQNFTQNLNQSLDLVTIWSKAMESAGIKQTEVVSEIPKLLEGNIVRQSKILEVMHLTKEEWFQIRDEAMKHHDLLERITPLLKPYLDAQEQLAARQREMTAQMELMQTRVFATMAEPLWKAWNTQLEKARDWFLAHKEQLNAIAGSLGNLLESLFTFVKTIFDVIGATEHWKEIMGVVALIFVVLIEAVSTILSGITLLGKDLTSLLLILSDPDTWKRPGEAMKKFMGEALANADEFTGKFVKSAERINQVASGETTPGSSPDLLNQGVSATRGVVDKRPKKDGGVSKDLRQDFRAELQEIKAETENVINQQKELVAENKKSVQEAATVINAQLNAEIVKVIELTDKYKKLAIEKLNAQKAKAAGKDFTAVESETIKTDENRQSAQRQAASKERQKQDLADYQAEVRLRRQQTQDALNDIKTRAAQGKAFKSQALKEELAALRADAASQHVIFLQETADMGRNTDAYKKAVRDKMTADQQRANQARQLARQISEAEFQEAQVRREQGIKSIKDKIAVHEAELEQLKKNTGSTLEVRRAEKELEDQKVTLLKAELAVTEAQLAHDEALKIEIELSGQDVAAIQERIDKLKEEIETRKKLLGVQQEKADDAGQSTSSKTAGNFFGLADGESLKEAFSSVEGAANALATGFKNALAIIGQIQQGVQSGGVLGGIGAGLSAVGSFIPGPIGAVMGLAGGIMSMFGGMFKKAAEDMAKRLSKEFKEITDKLAAGTIDLKTAIADLQAKRSEAITKLSGMKGGQEQLDKLLPEFDKQIAALQKQAGDIKKKFEDALGILRLHSDELGNALKSWQDINAQVKEYIGAGGDAKKASEFLSLSLRKMKETTAQGLRSGEQDAIQDAIKLNELLKQRIKLVEDFQKQEFDLKNADAIERHQSNAVRNGQELAKARKEFEAQLKDIDSQISLEQKKVDKETELFHMSQDIDELHRRDEALTLIALDEQLKKYKDMQTIVNGIIQNVSGSFSLSDALLKALGLAPTATTPVGFGHLGGGGGGHRFSDDFEFLRRGQLPTPSSVDPNNLSLDALGQPVIGGASTTIGSLSLTVNTNQPVNGQLLYDQLNNEITRAQRQGRRGFYRRMSSGV